MSRIVHFEISARNFDRAKSFYKDVFGWSFQDVPHLNYTLIETGDRNDPGINGGFFAEGDHDQKVVNTIDVKGMDALLQKVESGGGAIVMPKTAMAGIGYLCYFKDTEGNLMGMMESDPLAL